MPSPKPATSLPWYELVGSIYGEAPKNRFQSREKVAEVVDCIGNDAAYIVHACNAYPQLVQALARILGEVEQMGTFGSGQPLLNARLSHDDVMRLRALLRSLGED